MSPGRFIQCPTVLFALLTAGGCALGGAEDTSSAGSSPGGENPPASEEEALDGAAETISAGDMAARIGFLASDALGGRGTPSRGLEVAAQYLASEFAALGLEPGGEDDGYIQRFPLPARPRDPEASGSVSPSQADTPESAPNVVAIFPGSDPELRDTYVVFSAHVDHLGVGQPDATGDSIYNGADDDASGTSALVEIAEAFAALSVRGFRPARSVLFLGVSGEERGLLGSEWFTDSPTIPLESIVANVNMDMISRNAPDTIVVIGQEYSSLGPLVRGVAAERADRLGLAVVRDRWPEERFFFRSDHYSFARKEIPALFFFAGVHEDYHQPSDEPHTVDAEKAARVARLAFYTAHAIASDPEPPRWTEEGLAEVRRMVEGGR
ncbi:MAG: M28 family peptidase [Longimicrobiales bacterium]|nr:M28 family peptidase [Longimicrobiales bacterium]